MNIKMIRTPGVLAVGPLLAATAVAGTVQLGSNLLTNGGAESVA
jgi:hypothetical protein